MRIRKQGILKYEWQDFEFKGYLHNTKMTKELFEKHYGKFEAMVFPQGYDKPYAVWSKEHVVLFLNEDVLGVASIVRNPSKYMFG